VNKIIEAVLVQVMSMLPIQNIKYTPSLSETFATTTVTTTTTTTTTTTAARTTTTTTTTTTAARTTTRTTRCIAV